jgi:hypothetical protein
MSNSFGTNNTAQTFSEDSTSGNPVPDKSTSQAHHALDVTDHPGEDATLDRTWGGGLCLYAVKTGDAQVKATPGVYCGYTVTVVTATGTIDIRDATAAGAGTIIDTIPIGTAAGSTKTLANAVTCATGIYIDYNSSATGTVRVDYV